MNALLAGQVHTIDNLPTYLAGALDSQSASPLVSETGGWVPFTMRVDAKPFSDVRVRQAMRLIADRQEMINQALNGFGRVANDLYAPFDDDYLGNDLPQRQQDIDQARPLRQAGQQDLEVELVTRTAVGAGGVESANLFVQHARKAGVRVRLQKVDSSIFYGEQCTCSGCSPRTSRTKLYLPQATAASLKSSPYNETHWYDELRGAHRLRAARARPHPPPDPLQDAQRMEYEQGGVPHLGVQEPGGRLQRLRHGASGPRASTRCRRSASTSSSPWRPDERDLPPAAEQEPQDPVSSCRPPRRPDDRPPGPGRGGSSGASASPC